MCNISLYTFIVLREWSVTVFSLVMQLDYRLLFEKHKVSFLFHLIINYSDVCCWCYFFLLLFCGLVYIV